MLVLTRRENERIVLPTLQTSIQVVRIAGSTVRLGIEAPPEVPVLREELLHALEHGTQKLQDPACQQEFRREEIPCRNPSESEGRVDYEKLLDCVAVAFELLETQLSRGQMDAARETIRKALFHVAAARRELRPAHATGETGRESPSQKERVALVVQNLKKSHRPIAPVLERAGYKVRVVANGCQALDYLAHHSRPELIILDFDDADAARKTPCDTVRALQEIRQNPGLKGVKVIALGSRSPAELQVTIGPFGVDQWVQTERQAELFLRQLDK